MSLESYFEMTPPEALECYFFGSARLVLNDRELKLSFKKVLALMAYLALEGSTSRSKLVDLLWSDLNEDSARRNLRRELHRMKTKTPQLGGRCESAGDDLRLREPFSSDAQTFLDAVARDDPETALGLYKGVLLEGLELAGASGFHEWLEVKREFFERQHKKAMLDLAERLETRGEWRRALELHLKLLEQDELQERQHREIMRLHYLLGEREAALEQFERFKVMLNTELRLEPLPETLELARQIRAAQTLMPRAQTRVSSQALLLPRTAPLVGRAEVWARMEAAWTAGQIIFVSGEPGVGKTRLLLEFASSKGSFFQSAGRPGDSLAPYSTATRSITDMLEQGLKTEIPTWVRRELSKLVPELTSELPPATGSPEERLRFFQAFAELLTLEVSTLVSDDLQFFDAASLELGFHALQRFSGSGRHVMLGFRRGELQVETERLIEQFIASGQAVLIELEALAETDVLELVRGLSGADGATLFSKRLHRATGGNPFFALETIRNLFDTELLTLDSSGAWITPFDRDTSDYAELPIPPSVREAVLRRVRGLGAPSQRLLEVASLTSDGFSLETLQGATALSEWEGLEGLETAIRARILEPFSEGYKFAHDLMRSSIAENLSLERQKLLHKKLAASLEKTFGAPARIADHLEKANLKLEAVPWRVKAAQAAEKVYANPEALEQYQLALKDGAGDLEAFNIRKSKIQLLAVLSDLGQWQTELEHLIPLVARLDNPSLEIELRIMQIRLLRQTAPEDHALSPLEQLRSRVDLTSAQRCEVDSLIGAVLFKLGQTQEAETYLKSALSLLELKPSKQLGFIYSMLGQSAREQGNYIDAMRYHLQAKSIAEFLDDQIGQITQTINFSYAQASSGDVNSALLGFEQALTQSRAVGSIRHEISSLLNLGHYLTITSNLEKAKDVLEQALVLSRQSQHHTTESTVLGNLAELHRLRGELGAATTFLQEAQGIADKMKNGRSFAQTSIDLADVLIQLGDFDAAKINLEAARQLIEAGQMARLQDRLEPLLALVDLKAKEPKRAFDRLHRLEVEQPNSKDDANVAWLKGMALLALGQRQLALETIQTHLQESDPELRSRLIALRLEATTRLGADIQTLTQEAAKLLESGRVPPLEALELRVALSQALETNGNLEQAQEVRQTARTSLLEMAASLEDHPELQKLFLEKNRDLLTI